MTTQDPPDRMSDDEIEELLRLMTRYCDLELDQWDYWRLPTKWGGAYVRITNQVPPGEPEDVYRPMTRPK
jgi:hypothetical protein